MTHAAQSPIPPSLWIEIDSTALAGNVHAVRSALTGPDGTSPKIIAVVKANGYGHGIVAAATALVAGGADALAVTTFDEASELMRDEPASGDGWPNVLVFAPPCDARQAAYGVVNGLTMTVCDPAGVQLVGDAAADSGRAAGVHLKVDTGMSRFGLEPDKAFEVARLIARSSNLRLTGVYTHFAQALAPDLQPTRGALARFIAFCDRLRAAGIDHGLRHCAASAAALRLPESHLDMVRLGTIFYGQYPAPNMPEIAGLNAATWTMRARVAFVHDIEPGATVGYGAEYRASTTRRVAVLPVGFADGFATAPSSVFQGFRGLKALIAQITRRSGSYVTFDGVRAPVLGRVAMQTIVVDVTDIPDVVGGSVAEVPMRRLAARSSIPRIVKT